MSDAREGEAMDYLYRIDVEDRRVVRFDERGVRMGWLSFEDLAAREPHWCVAFGPKVTAMYMVARDELIDRGLIRE